MSVWKVKTVIITSIGLAVILVTMYVETFKTDVVLYVDHCEIKNSNKNSYRLLQCNNFFYNAL